MRKILIVSENIFPRNMTCGHRVQSWMNDFAQFGYEPVLLCPHYTSKNCKNYASELEQKVAGRRVMFEPGFRISRDIRRLWAWMMPFAGAAGFRTYFRFIASGKALLREEKFDFILCTSPSYVSIFVAHALSRASGVPFAVDFRDIPGEHGELPAPVLEKHKRMLRRLLADAAFLNGVTPGLSAWLRELMPGKKVITAFNGFDPADYLSLRYHRESPVFNLVFAGDITDSMPVALLVATLDAFIASAQPETSRFKVEFYGKSAVYMRRCPGLDAHSCFPYLYFGGTVPMNEMFQIQHEAAMNLVFSVMNPPGLIIPSKVFYLMPSRRPILLIGEDTECAPILRGAGFDTVVSNADAGARLLQLYFEEFLKTGHKPAPVAVNLPAMNAYSRAMQTQRLAAEFDAFLA